MTVRPSRSKAIADKCKSCIYDPIARGAWREQVADCVSADCALHPVRPVPRHCVVNGVIDPAKVAEVRAKLQFAEDRARAARAKADRAQPQG